ncbi:MAG: hypothetical protein GC150_07930 [Rhizobiales bacterium]|nr:hypothetical protein [Hyphomicrobiales bacterium]
MGLFTGGGDQQLSAQVPQSGQMVRKSVAFTTPVFGAPDKISKQLEAAVVAETERLLVPVVKTAGVKADYVVRGYVVAAPGTAGTELSYIWDVLDGTDKRVHRITGKRVIAGAAQRDPWALVSAAELQAVATQTATDLAAFIPATQAPAPVAPASTAPAIAQTGAGQPALAQAQPTPLAPQAAAASQTAQPQQAVVRAAPQPAASTAQPIVAIVPPVTGAPGDGNNSLAGALQRHLAKKGIRTTASGGGEFYTVKGSVQMGPPTAGNQAIRIEWAVLDPSGKHVRTVVQRNTVPQGALNQAWGATAEGAAETAVPSIISIIQQRQQAQAGRTTNG